MHAALDTFTDALAQLVDNGYIASGSDVKHGFHHGVASGSLFVTGSSVLNATSQPGGRTDDFMVLCVKKR